MSTWPEKKLALLCFCLGIKAGGNAHEAEALARSDEVVARLYQEALTIIQIINSGNTYDFFGEMLAAADTPAPEDESSLRLISDWMESTLKKIQSNEP